jgi:uncharacterized membrane protein
LSELLHEFGELHRVFVHFPVALIFTAAVAEALYMTRRSRWMGEAARFMVAAGALAAIPTVAAGFAEASGETYSGEAARAFSIHWVGGVTAAVLAILAFALGEGSRRTGQVWEQGLYRIVLLLAVAAVVITGFFGGVIGHAGS